MTEHEPAPETEFRQRIGKVVRRELANHGYTRFQQLTTTTAAELLKIHGVGKKGMAILCEELAARGMSFAGES